MKNDLQKASAELIMARFREAMAAGDAAASLREDREPVTRDVFEAMQKASPNVELHRQARPKISGVDR